MKKELFINYMEDLKKYMNDISTDFIYSYGLESYGYICDSFNEFADSETSIYYSEQKEFYNNNVELCEQALLDYGYNLNDMLRNGDTLEDLICRAGAIGEYQQNISLLYEDEKEIILYLICEYVNSNNLLELTIEDIESIADTIDNGDRWDDIIDKINEAIKEKEEEEE